MWVRRMLREHLLDQDKDKDKDRDKVSGDSEASVAVRSGIRVWARMI
jgi:hypothetical protein